jgi:fumarate reductase flavoprotein subunit
MGIAGHGAALEAGGAGASTLLIHAEDRVGGSTRLSTGIFMGANTRYQRTQGISEDSAERFYSEYMIANHWQVQPSVARRLCLEAGRTLDWLEDRGVIFLRLMGSGDETYPRGHVTRGGEAIMLTLHAHIQKLARADLALNTRVERLLVEEGKVVGIHAAGQDVRAKAVVLACGGIGGDLDLLAKWQPNMFVDGSVTPRYFGSSYARGDALRLTADLGAQVVAGRSLSAPIWEFGGGYLPGYMVAVNALGRRFMDETAAYGIAEPIFSAQPGSLAHVIFDDDVKCAMRSSSDVFAETKKVLPETEPAIAMFASSSVDDLVASGHIVKAQTLDQLAARIGVPSDNLRGTITRYNQQISKGRDDDYLKVAKVFRAVAKGPFYSFSMRPKGFALTTTGVRIDHDAQVLRQDSLPIPGLFAAGECTGGIIVKVYFGSGNALTQSSTYGRIAGRNAASYALEGAVPLVDWLTIERRA